MNKIIFLEEKLLINEIQKGNQAVFERLFNQYYKTLVTFAEHFLLSTDLSEDVVQSVFINIWENSKSLNVEKSLRSYLYQTVKNRCLNQLRSLKIRDKYQLMYFEALINNHAEDFNDNELTHEINKAINRLPARIRDIFCRKYFLEQSVKEISDALSVSENTIKVQLFNGRHRIKEMLKTATGCTFFL